MDADSILVFKMQPLLYFLHFYGEDATAFFFFFDYTMTHFGFYLSLVLSLVLLLFCNTCYERCKLYLSTLGDQLGGFYFLFMHFVWNPCWNCRSLFCLWWRSLFYDSVESSVCFCVKGWLGYVIVLDSRQTLSCPC